jgi:hypothetical protein
VELDLRLIVPAPDGPLVLLDSGGRLPAMTVDGDDDHATIVAVDEGLRARWAFTTPVLETHPRRDGVEDGAPVPTLVATEPADAAWRPPAGLAFASIPDGLDDVHASIRDRADELLGEIRTGSAPPPLRPRWARRGWHDRARAWMRAAAAASGHPLTGEPRPQLPARHLGAPAGADGERRPLPQGGLSAVPRGAVVTRFLADRYPGSVPRVVDVEPDEGWLLVEDVAAPWMSGLQAGRLDAVAIGARALVAIQRDVARRPADLAGLKRAGAVRRRSRRSRWISSARLGPTGSASGTRSSRRSGVRVWSTG